MMKVLGLRSLLVEFAGDQSPKTKDQRPAPYYAELILTYLKRCRDCDRLTNHCDTGKQ